MAADEDIAKLLEFKLNLYVVPALIKYKDEYKLLDLVVINFKESIKKDCLPVIYLP